MRNMVIWGFAFHAAQGFSYKTIPQSPSVQIYFMQYSNISSLFKYVQLYTE